MWIGGGGGGGGGGRNFLSSRKVSPIWFVGLCYQSCEFLTKRSLKEQRDLGVWILLSVAIVVLW
jgi:hypothetical protein